MYVYIKDHRTILAIIEEEWGFITIEYVVQAIKYDSTIFLLAAEGSAYIISWLSVYLKK